MARTHTPTPTPLDEMRAELAEWRDRYADLDREHTALNDRYMRLLVDQVQASRQAKSLAIDEGLRVASRALSSGTLPHLSRLDSLLDRFTPREAHIWLPAMRVEVEAARKLALIDRREVATMCADALSQRQGAIA